MPISKLRKRIVRRFLKSKQTEADAWQCCDTLFNSITDMGRHVNQIHQAEIDAAEKEEATQVIQSKQQVADFLKQRRGQKGSSDPISVECCCQQDGSKVILFYKYVSIKDPVQFALEHEKRCANMTGKVRIASEGINATLAGANRDIDDYLNWITLTEPFNDLQDLHHPQPLELKDTSTPRYKFFKPSPGCSHVFSELSIKLVDEICPLGQTSVVLDKLLQDPSHRHGKLSPSDFHAILAKRHQDDFILLDTRNYYESKIGYFEGAIQPPIRKFSQFPEYVERNKEAMKGKTILTYCTGGIRCEKATAYMRQALPEEDIFMLDGGIHNYMEWWKTTVTTANHDSGDDPVWQGKNYLFDARQSLGLGDGSIVSQCQQCGKPWDKYRKCMSVGCHLLVLQCDDCYALLENKVHCCHDCKEGQQNGLCACERSRREKELKQIEV